MQIKHRFNPFKETGITVPKANRKEALEAVATYVKEQVLSNTAEGVTSVEGGQYRRRITKEYAAEKDGPAIANMENSGEMMDAFDTDVDGNYVELAISGDQAGKAEGNLKGTYGQDKPIDGGKYIREFMPYKKGMKLSNKIMRGVEKILEEYEE